MKTWLITGASSGLGRAMTEKLLRRGDRVIGTARRTEALSDLSAAHGELLHVAALDLTDTAAIRATIDNAFARFGRIDVIVSNAAYGLFGAAEELADEQIDRQLATNLTGSIQLIRASLPHLRAQGGGRIVQVSSEGGQIAYPGFSLYHASKWGIEGFIEAVAQEVAPFGIDFIIAEPGATATNFGAALDHGKPMDVYERTPAGDVRRAISSGGFAIRGDAANTVEAMIATADADHPPFRLALGSTAYENIRAALTKRLQALEPLRSIAYSADRNTKRLVNPISLYDGSPLGLSQGVVDEERGLLFVSGQVDWNEQHQVSHDSMGGQFDSALNKLKVVLSEAGASVDDILHLRIYVRGELEDHMETLVPLLSRFLGASRTAITGVGVSSLASRATLVEVEATVRHTQGRAGPGV
jgi:NAD(P)-dependent dehydrogenase (short-subunit alcohol dehydrogenase family)